MLGRGMSIAAEQCEGATRSGVYVPCYARWTQAATLSGAGGVTEMGLPLGAGSTYYWEMRAGQFALTGTRDRLMFSCTSPITTPAPYYASSGDSGELLRCIGNYATPGAPPAAQALRWSLTVQGALGVVCVEDSGYKGWCIRADQSGNIDTTTYPWRVDL